MVRQGLLLIDIQNDYFPGGKMKLVDMEQAARNAAMLLQQFRLQQAPVFHVQHISTRPGSTFFLPGTEGVEIHHLVCPQPGEIVIEKHFPNSFRDTTLLDYLNGAHIEAIVICGAMIHMCIDATTRAAFDLGFRCTVIEDACATRNLQYKGKNIEATNVHAAFMAALSLPYATVITAEEFLGTGS